MHEGSRFASLSRRAHALLGSGTAAPAITAVVVEGAAAPAAGDGNTAEAEAAAAAAAEAEATAAAEAQAAEEAEAARVAAAEPGALLAIDDPKHPAFVNGAATARAEERQRVADVFASDASKGKERAAAKLLANPKLSAEDIIGLLPDVAANASDKMLATLAGAPNPDIGAGNEAPSGSGSGIAVWDRIRNR